MWTASSSAMAGASIDGAGNRQGLGVRSWAWSRAGSRMAPSASGTLMLSSRLKKALRTSRMLLWPPWRDTRERCVHVVITVPLLPAEQCGFRTAWSPRRKAQCRVLLDGSSVHCFLRRSQIRGLDWNLNSQNLLASGAADGECLVWDLTDLTQPANFKVVRICFARLFTISDNSPGMRTDAIGCAHVSTRRAVQLCFLSSLPDIYHVVKHLHTLLHS